MNELANSQFFAFAGNRCLVSGELLHVALTVKEALEQGETELILIFNDLTCRQVEIDFRGTKEDVQRRIVQQTEQKNHLASTGEPPTETPRGPGRPKLGVVAREVTLLPRHWDWLNNQPGGASVALRKLVEEARRSSVLQDQIRNAQEACYRFMMVMAGDFPGFEEAIRALYAGNPDRFNAQTESWPIDIRAQARKLADRVFQDDLSTPPATIPA